MIQRIARLYAFVAALALYASPASPAPVPDPKVFLESVMAEPLPLAVFVNDGATALLNGIRGARLRLFDNSTFTIGSDGKLPPIVGRWSSSPVAGEELIILWAKMDQIDFNAQIVPLDLGGQPLPLPSQLAISAFVQVNAPRTDGGPAATPKPDSLKQASMHFLQLLMRP